VTSHDSHKSENDAAAVENRLSANNLLECALNDMARDVFKVPNAARRQKHYMRNCLFLNDTTVREWGKRLMELNKYFPFFPIENQHDDSSTGHEGLPDDELNDILDRAKPISWHTTMLESNLEVQDMSWDKILDYYEKLEMSDLIKKLGNGNEDKSESHNGKRKRNKGHSNDNNHGSGKSAKNKGHKTDFECKTPCVHCKKSDAPGSR
jgi:hypothetical protein